MGYECAAATNQATTQRSLGYSGHRERDWGRNMAGGKGSQKRCATGSSKDGCFYFPFHSRQGFSGCLVGALGGSNKNAQGDSKPRGPVLWEEQAGKPRGGVFYSDHTDSGLKDEEREGQQAASGRDVGACLAAGARGGGMVLGKKWRPHCIIVYGIWEHEGVNNPAVSTRNKRSFLSVRRC